MKEVKIDYGALNESDDDMAIKLGTEPSNQHPISRTKIENIEAEALVLEWVIQDVPPQTIVERLNDLYPDSENPVVEKDVRSFIVRNRNITRAMVKSDKNLLQRHMHANFAFRDKLLKMQDISCSALEKAADQENYQAIASLQNSILKNIHLFAKMAGILETAENKIEINIAQQVSDAMASKLDGQRGAILASAKVIEADFEDLGEEIGSETE